MSLMNLENSQRSSGSLRELHSFIKITETPENPKERL